MSKKADKKQNKDLKDWQKKIGADETVWSEEVSKMDQRENQYRGKINIEPVCEGDTDKTSYHETMTTYELIEAQIDTNIPSPKVTAIHKKDEGRAKVIEDMLRNELERIPFEEMNDQNERTSPLQGGTLWHVEWDNNLRTHKTIGDLVVKTKHPKQIIPQAGVYTNVDDMDHFALKLPVTKEYINRRYKVDVTQEGEGDPSAKALDGESPADDMVTQYVVYYRNEKGGIGIFSWVNDVVLEDIDDYQARRLRHCKECGAVEPLDSDPLEMPTPDGRHPLGNPGEALPLGFDGNVKKTPQSEPLKSGKKCCPHCGCTEFTDQAEEFEEVWDPIESTHGVQIPGAIDEIINSLDDMGQPRLKLDGTPMTENKKKPTQIPFYKPDVFPVVLQRSVSVFGQLLGNSDVDAIVSQHNSRNRIAAKMMEKLIKAGSLITLPTNARIKKDSSDMKYITIDDAKDKLLIGEFDLAGDIEQDYILYKELYEEARNIVGITNSYQGRKDNTATSGKAKEFSAAQAAGRLESKRTMKDAAYARLFEIMFKFKLAYSDEARPIHTKDDNGDVQYDLFDRYDFLEQDEAGQWFWNDQFIFSCDTSASLASNREAMWQETRMNFQSGAYGNPTELDTMILFWTKMAELHYPDAESTKRSLQERLKRQQEQQAQAMEMQQQAQAQEMEMRKMELANQTAEIKTKADSDVKNTALKEVGSILKKKGGESNGNNQVAKKETTDQLHQ